MESNQATCNMSQEKEGRAIGRRGMNSLKDNVIGQKCSKHHMKGFVF